LEQGRAVDGFAHWLAIGIPAGLLSREPETEKVTVSQAKALAYQAAAALLPLAGRSGYRFECWDDPVVSVVLIVNDGFAMTMATIASLRANSVADIELIVVDRGSRDETRFIGQYTPGAKVLRFGSLIDWSRAADAGRQLAQAPLVLFLSATTQLAPGSVDRALARLAGEPNTGALGGMVLQSHGVIAQAGGILWNDGGTHDYGRGESALMPEANFVRQVDYCGPSFLLVVSTMPAPAIIVWLIFACALPRLGPRSCTIHRSG
jgi:hypothetical protein